jgi:hypothetical protein
MSIQSRALHLLCFLAFLFPPLASAGEKKSAEQIRNEKIHETASYVLDQCAQLGWEPFAIYAGFVACLLFFIIWPVSKFLAGEDGEGGWKKSLAYIAQWLGMMAILTGLGIVCIRAEWLSILAILSLSATFATVGLAKQVFEVSVWRGIGFYLCTVVAAVAAEFASDAVTAKMPWREYWDKTEEEQNRLISEWRIQKKERESSPATTAAASANPAPATVQELYANLQKGRAELNVNDPEAVARFNEQVAAYNAAKAAAAPPAPATASTSPKTSNSAKTGKPDKKKSESKTQ